MERAVVGGTSTIDVTPSRRLAFHIVDDRASAIPGRRK
jgi:hypothetical protein